MFLFDVGILHAGLKGASVELRRGELLGLELALGLEHLVLGPVEHRVDVVLRLRAQRELLLLGAQELLFFSHERLLVVLGIVELSPKLLLLVLEFLLRRKVEDAMAVRALALRAVQSLAVVDIRNYRDLVFRIGEFESSGEDPQLGRSLP